MKNRSRITNFDTTPGKAERFPGRSPAHVERAETAVGVDVIGAGPAISSPGDLERARAVGVALTSATALTDTGGTVTPYDVFEEVVAA